MYGLSQIDIDLIISIIAEYPDIEKVLLYGSRAMHTHKRGSDIDFTLQGKNLKLNTLLALSAKLNDTNLPYIFDISLYHHIQNPELIDHIQRVGIEFYSKK